MDIKKGQKHNTISKQNKLFNTTSKLVESIQSSKDEQNEKVYIDGLKNKIEEILIDSNYFKEDTNKMISKLKLINSKDKLLNIFNLLSKDMHFSATYKRKLLTTLLLEYNVSFNIDLAELLKIQENKQNMTEINNSDINNIMTIDQKHHLDMTEEFPNLNLLIKPNKDDRLIVRMDSDLKEKFVKFVENKGATVSDYVRQMIVSEMSVVYENTQKSAIDIINEITNPEIDIYRQIKILTDRINDLENAVELQKIESITQVQRINREIRRISENNEV